MSTRTTKCVFFLFIYFYFIFTHDPQLSVPSGASRTHKNTQNRSLFVFPAPIDETVSASYHSVLSFNLLLFFSFLLSLSFFQPRTSNQPALRDRLRAVSSNIRRNKHRYPHFSGFSQLFCVFKRFCLAKHVLIVFCFVFFFCQKDAKTGFTVIVMCAHGNSNALLDESVSFVPRFIPSSPPLIYHLMTSPPRMAQMQIAVSLI